MMWDIVFLVAGVVASAAVLFWDDFFCLLRSITKNSRKVKKESAGGPESEGKWYLALVEDLPSDFLDKQK